MHRYVKILSGLLLFAVVTGPATAAEVSREQAAERFTAANAAYREGDYARAQSDYQAIVDAGWESGAVYFNLANAYFKLNELGEAIAYYDRALRLRPRDADLRANANFARSLVPSDTEDAPALWQRLWQGHLDFYSRDEMAVILLMLLLIAGGVHVAAVYRGWPRRRVRSGLLLMGLVFLVYLLGLIAKIEAGNGRYVVITPTTARFEPRDEATAHYEIPEGRVLRLQKQEGAWARVERADGKTGWVPREDLLEM